MRYPAQAERIVDFVNTEDVRRPDRREPPFAPDDALADGVALDRWLAGNGLAIVGHAAPDDLDLARRLRTALRGVLRRDGVVVSADASAVNDVARDLPLVVKVDGSGQPVAEPLSSGARGALTRLLSDLLLLHDAGELDRLKSCAADDCRWAFVDRSRPGSGRWCSSRACGNRDKTRRYRGSRRRVTRATRTG